MRLLYPHYSRGSSADVLAKYPKIHDLAIDKASAFLYNLLGEG